MMDNFADVQLFPKDMVVGVFRGFQQGGLEFHADLVLPYRNEFQNIPMHGQFLLVQLETPDEAVLGRITSLSSDGKTCSWLRRGVQHSRCHGGQTHTGGSAGAIPQVPREHSRIGSVAQEP